MSEYFLFFRYWPGFGPPFPFDRFHSLPDEELVPALDAYAREQLRLPAVRDQIKQEARHRRRRFVEAMIKQAHRRTGGPPRSFRPPLSPKKTGSQMRWAAVRHADRTDPLVCRLGAYLGWWGQGGTLIGRKVGFPIIWFLPATSLTFAEQLVKELSRQRDLDYPTHQLEYHTNPQYGFVSAEGLSDGQQASIRRCINAIQEGREPDVQDGKLALLIGQRAIRVAKELYDAWPGKETEPKEEVPLPEADDRDSASRRPVPKGANGNGAPVPVLTIAKWEELGIGIDEDSRYLAVSPPPELGDVFPKERAIELDLRGNQWRILLDLLAKSEHGNTATKIDVMTAFRYCKQGGIADEDEVKDSSQKMTVLHTASGHLTGAMADLGRKLRKLVQGPTAASTPVLSTAEPKVVQAAFVTRYLLRGADRKLHFGKRIG